MSVNFLPKNLILRNYERKRMIQKLEKELFFTKAYSIAQIIGIPYDEDLKLWNIVILPEKIDFYKRKIQEEFDFYLDNFSYFNHEYKTLCYKHEDGSIIYFNKKLNRCIVDIYWEPLINVI